MTKPHKTLEEKIDLILEKSDKIDLILEKSEKIDLLLEKSDKLDLIFKESQKIDGIIKTQEQHSVAIIELKDITTRIDNRLERVEAQGKHTHELVELTAMQTLYHEAELGASKAMRRKLKQKLLAT
jgi:cupin superfamily acireductone dioxygenase involved in methionine salvage